MAQSVFTGTSHHSLRWDGHLVESQEGLETEVGPRADLVEAALMCLDSLRLSSCARNPHTCNLVPRGTQISYSVALDLVAKLGRLLVLRLVARLRDFVGHKMLLERTVEVQGDNNCFNHLRDRRITLYVRVIPETHDRRLPRVSNVLVLHFIKHIPVPSVVTCYQLMVRTPIDVSEIAEVKYLDCDIYVENVTLFGDLIALPFEGYDMTLGMDGCLNITLK
ncbi:hypothetical protein M9H77_17610 [Catharanthus roseus]|uniref:Uncharacterized protein n=1 Tax=Catharanthus roseus TaxID=4058 RepID=A0ACC0B532_CATRO|nr:hypothetical protein M9H77_17610 [Catharanthus roseus]